MQGTRQYNFQLKKNPNTTKVLETPQCSQHDNYRLNVSRDII